MPIPYSQKYKIDWYSDTGNEIFWDSLDSGDKQIMKDYLSGFFITNNVKNKKVSFLIVPRRIHVWEEGWLGVNNTFTYYHDAIHEVLQDMRIGRKYILSRWEKDSYMINFVYESP